MSDYWTKRLTNFFDKDGFFTSFKKYDQVTFRKGYGTSSTTMTFDIAYLRVGIPIQEWCFPTTENHFIIGLGQRIYPQIKDDTNGTTIN